MHVQHGSAESVIRNMPATNFLSKSSLMDAAAIAARQPLPTQIETHRKVIRTYQSKATSSAKTVPTSDLGRRKVGQTRGGGVGASRVVSAFSSYSTRAAVKAKIRSAALNLVVGPGGVIDLTGSDDEGVQTRRDMGSEVVDLTMDSDSDQDGDSFKRLAFPFKTILMRRLHETIDCMATAGQANNEMKERNNSMLNALMDLFSMTSRQKRNRGPRTIFSDTLNFSVDTATSISAHFSTKARLESPLTEISNNPVSPALLSELILVTSWLTDEGINAFVACLQLKYPKVKFFSSFFYSLLTDKKRSRGKPYNYEGVRRWTKKQENGIWDYDAIVIPINKGNVHWCLAYVCLKSLRFGFLDSMNGSAVFAKKTFENIRQYLLDEWDDKVGRKKDQQKPAIEQLEFRNLVPVCPKQGDASSCGVFVCYFALWAARQVTRRKEDGTKSPGDVGGQDRSETGDMTEFSFSQRDANAFRRDVAFVLCLPVFTSPNE
ncbi:hypothetical protein BJ741DRAFT_628582 [Chytriomyces cf. hyalinus JEL632]|nr:hypothetical protein BJ741DRAFT_628582 [Chytriomyces cf. hyalinus JEL632]